MTVLRKFVTTLDIHVNRDDVPEEANIVVLTQLSENEWKILGSSKCDDTGTTQIPVEIQSPIYPNYPVYAVAALPWGVGFTSGMTVIAGDYIRPTNFNGWVFKCLSGGEMPHEEPDWDLIINSNSSRIIGDISLKAFKHYQPITHGPIGDIEWVETGFDPYWDKVVSLLHFDGETGSTTFVDAKGVIWTAAGNAKIDASDPDFSEGALLLDGSGDYLTTASTAELSADRDSFTIECTIKIPSHKTIAAILTKRAAYGAGEFSLVIENQKLAALAWGESGAVVVEVRGNTAVPLNQAVHIALSVSGPVWRLFMDGKLEAEVTRTAPVLGKTQNIHLGRDPSNVSRDFNGLIDEFRWTADVARYTENFNPPTTPFPNVGPFE